MVSAIKVWVYDVRLLCGKSMTPCTVCVYCFFNFQLCVTVTYRPPHKNNYKKNTVKKNAVAKTFSIWKNENINDQTALF